MTEARIDLMREKTQDLMKHGVVLSFQWHFLSRNQHALPSVEDKLALVFPWLNVLHLLFEKEFWSISKVDTLNDVPVSYI